MDEWQSEDQKTGGGEQGRRRAQGWLAPTLVGLLGLALTGAAIGGLWFEGRREDQRRFESEGDRMWQRLEQAMLRIEDSLAVPREFCTRLASAPREELAAAWKNWTQSVHPPRLMPGLWELGYADVVASGEVAREAHTFLAGVGPDVRLEVRESWIQNPTRPPHRENLHTPDSGPAIRASWRDGAPRITGRVQLAKRADGRSQTGFRLFVPIYDTAAGAMGRQPKGVLFGGFLLETMAVNQLGARPRIVEMEIYAGTEPGPSAWLTEPDRPGFWGAHRTVVPDEDEAMRRRVEKTIYGATWTVEFRTTMIFPRSIGPEVLGWVGAAGVMLSLGLAAAVRLQVVRRMEAEAATTALALAERKVRREAEERERLVRDLHERTIQSLLAVNAQLVRCAGEAGEPAAERLRADLDLAAADLEAAVGEVRDGILRIGPASGDDLPLGEAIEQWLARLNRGRGTQLICECDEAVAARLGVRERDEVTAIVREAVSNALRHGEAQRVVVGLREMDGRAVVAIHDDGVGFEPTAAVPGHGLDHLRARARDLGGELSIESRPGGPTTLRVEFPLRASAEGRTGTDGAGDSP